MFAHRSPLVLRRLLSFATAVSLLATPVATISAELTISQLPLAKSRSADVLPNLMFILDDSGSMGSDYLPDNVNDNDTCRSARAQATITFTAATNAVVSAIKVNPQGSCTVSRTNLMDGSLTSSSSDPSTVASRIDNEELGGDGWTIDRSGSTITIYNSDGTASPLGCQMQVVLSSGSLSPLTATFGGSSLTKACSNGDPPYQSADFNRIYYNPEFVYAPASTLAVSATRPRVT